MDTASATRQAEYSHRYNATHKYKRREYRRSHAAAIAEYNRRWRAAHREQRRQSGRKWRANHRAERIVHDQEYHAAHLAQGAAYARMWRKAHPEMKRAQRIIRRTRERGNGGKYVVADWLALCDAWGNKCLRCGTTERLTCDHIIPVSLGGTSNLSNLQLLCMPCNNKKKLRTTDYRPKETK
jgi:5-methylcytosine-specific restriction endonuclease McrA